MARIDKTRWNRALAAAADAPAEIRWRSVLVLEGELTDDGRLIDADALDWRDLPLTLMAMVETSAGGHEGASVAGRIDSIVRVGSEVIGEGIFDAGDYGQEIARMVGDQTLRGVSVDLAIREFELRNGDGELIDDDIEAMFSDDVVFAVTDASIMGATVCPFPAFADANIVLLADGMARLEFGTIELVEDALTAGLAPLLPPAEWFENPRLSEPTALTVTPEGRVFGHVAAFGVCHIGDPHGNGSCVMAPRSPSGYSYFHLGVVETAEATEVAVGQITLGTGHASRRADRTQAAAHYDDTGTAMVDGRCGEDAHGIWFAGALRPDVSAERVRELSAAKLSGDWRPDQNGRLELVGILAVNVPGFPVPRPEARVAVTAAGQHVLALTAAGIIDGDCGCEPAPALTDEQAQRRTRLLAARARGGVSGLAARARAA